jgi:DNA primase
MTAGSGAGWRIDDVLVRTDLASLLDDLAQPAMYATRGRRWHCPVPEHDDHHASVTIHTDHRGHERWRCWSGDDNHRGDAIDLVTRTQRVNRSEAVDWLAQRAGMVPDLPLPTVTPKKPTAAARLDVPLDPAVIRYVGACERILWRPAGRPVLDWLHGRGFNDELLRVNHVGADPGRQMMQRQRGLPYGGGMGAVLPALHEAGTVAYVQTRYLEPGNGPKYDNPAAALGANPRLAWARSAGPARACTLIVCEGIPDALTAAGAGFASVAVLGSQAPDFEVAGRIATAARRNERNVVAVIDNDDPGRAAGERLRELLGEFGVDVTVIVPPAAGLDLNSWAAIEHEWPHVAQSGSPADGFAQHSRSEQIEVG